MANKNRIQKLLDDYVNTEVKRAKSDYDRIIYRINKDLEKELNKMYDAFIDKFYSTPTKSYRRQGWLGRIEPNTPWGENLYEGNHIRTYGVYRSPKLVVEIDSTGMMNDYEYDDAETVLSYVMQGVRFPFFHTPSWKGSYSGKYFTYNNTTPYLAFTDFNRRFDDIVENEFYTQWKEIGWCD